MVHQHTYGGLLDTNPKKGYNSKEMKYSSTIITEAHIQMDRVDGASVRDPSLNLL
jgi:hypothetical protein